MNAGDDKGEGIYEDKGRSVSSSKGFKDREDASRMQCFLPCFILVQWDFKSYWFELL
jgi:hypothetical protein